MEAAAHSLNKLSLARTQWDVNYSLQYVANWLEVKNGERNEEILDLILDLREGFHFLFLSGKLMTTMQTKLIDITCKWCLKSVAELAHLNFN